MENRQHEEVSQFQFTELLGKFEQLTARRSLIEQLRDKYFAALRTGDKVAARSAIQEAKDQDVELFEDMPLGQLEELAAIQLLAKQLKDSGLPDPAALARLKDENPIELQNKLDLLSSAVTRLQKLSGPERLAVLDNATAKARRWLKLDRAVANLILLRMMAIREYDGKAGAILEQLASDEELAEELRAEIDAAKSEYVSWQNLRTGNGALVTRLEEIERTVNSRMPMAEVDRQWVAGLAVRVQPPPGVLVRLLQPLQSRDPITITVLPGLPQEQRDFFRNIAEWWEQWRECGASQALDQIDKRLKLLDQRVHGYLALPATFDLPGAREALLGWYTRINQAQKLIAYLEELNRGASLSDDSESNVAMLRRMNEIIDSVPDEVYFLFHRKWRESFKQYADKAKAGRSNSSERARSARSTALDRLCEAQEKRFAEKYRQGKQVVEYLSSSPYQRAQVNGDNWR